MTAIISYLVLSREFPYLLPGKFFIYYFMNGSTALQLLDSHRCGVLNRKLNRLKTVTSRPELTSGHTDIQTSDERKISLSCQIGDFACFARSVNYNFFI